MSFSQFNFNESILRAITACKYNQPTPVQAQTIPHITNGKDVVVSAPTGTGKTAAFVLPILQHLLLKTRHQKTRVLILAPTRELAQQITSVISKYSKFMQINLVGLIGGMNYQQQQRKMARPIDIIVATPGRLIDYMDNHRLDLSHIEILVLDEADRMLDMGFIGDIRKIIAGTNKARQTLLFSATADDKLMSILQHLLKNPVRINLTPKATTSNLIKQEQYLANDNEHKKNILLHLLQNKNIFKGIIFIATKRKAKRITTQLQNQGFSVAAIHGDLKQNARTRTLEQLRESKIQYLIATDVVARGIDVFDITHIINYDLPKLAEDYVHRIGRTGRAGKSGAAITLVLPEDVKSIGQIEKFLGYKIAQMTIAGLEPKELVKSTRANSKNNTNSTSKNNFFRKKKKHTSKNRQLKSTLSR